MLGAARNVTEISTIAPEGQPCRCFFFSRHFLSRLLGRESYCCMNVMHAADSTSENVITRVIPQTNRALWRMCLFW